MAAVDTAPQGATKARDPDGPVTYSLEQVKRITAPKTRRYWMGVIESAPFDHCSKAGLGLLKFKGAPPVDDDGSFNSSKIQARGDVYELTDAQVAEFVERVSNVIVRVQTSTSDSVDPKTNKPRTRQVVSKWMHLDSVEYDVQKDRKGEAMPKRSFTFTTEDVPLGYFLYCVPLREQMPVGWRDEKTPPRMCDVSSMVKAG
jgi:hypothetical protein